MDSRGIHFAGASKKNTSCRVGKITASSTSGKSFGSQEPQAKTNTSAAIGSPFSISKAGTEAPDDARRSSGTGELVRRSVLIDENGLESSADCLQRNPGPECPGPDNGDSFSRHAQSRWYACRRQVRLPNCYSMPSRIAWHTYS